MPGNVKDLDQSRKEVQDRKKNLIPIARPGAKILSARSPCRIGTWNVLTVCQTGKSAELLREFVIYQLDILGMVLVR